MNHLGVWQGALNVTAETLAKPMVCKGARVEFLNATTSGVFITELKCGVIVAAGEEIGQIVEPLTGVVLSRVVSPIQGYLFTIRAYPIVYEGSLMARIFRMEDEERA